MLNFWILTLSGWFPLQWKNQFPQLIMLHQHHPLGIDLILLGLWKLLNRKMEKLEIGWPLFVRCCIACHACLLETKVQNNGAVLEKDNGSDRLDRGWACYTFNSILCLCVCVKINENQHQHKRVIQDKI